MAKINSDSLLGLNLPTVFSRKISLDRGQDGRMIVNLNLVIKEILGGESGTWFTNQHFKALLRVKVIQLTDSVVIQTAREHIADAKFRNLILKDKSTISRDLNLFSDIIGPIGQPSNADALKEKYKTINEDGLAVYSIPFQVRFELDEEREVDDLAYVFYTFLDFESFALNFSQEEMENSTDAVGQIGFDVVIQNKQTFQNGLMFEDFGRKRWAGSVYRLQDGRWVKGDARRKSSLEIQDFLTPKRVSNTKVHDSRTLKRLDAQKVPDASLLESVRSIKDSKIQASMFLSRTERGSTRFNLIFDYYNLIKDHSAFGSFLQNTNPNTKRLILRNTKINSVKVTRRRMSAQLNGINSLGFPTRNKFDTQVPDFVVVESRDEKGRLLAKNEETWGNSIEEIDVHAGGSLFLRTFVGIDRSMVNVTDGIYRYGIEVEIEDGIFQFLKSLLLELSTSRVEIERFITKALVPSHYDADAERFTQVFVSTFEKSNEQRILNTAINNYLGSVQLVFGDQAREFLTLNGRMITAEDLRNMLHPRIATIKTMHDFLKAFIKLESRFAEAIGIEPGVTRENLLLPNEIARSSSSSNKPPKTITIQKLFLEEFDSNISNNFGMRIMEEQEEQETRNVLELTPAQLNVRNKEELDFFKIPEVDSPKGLFWTPEKIKTPVDEFLVRGAVNNQIKDFEVKLKNVKQNQGADYMRFVPVSNSRLDEDKQKRAFNFNGFFTQSGVNIAVVDPRIKQASVVNLLEENFSDEERDNCSSELGVVFSGADIDIILNPLGAAIDAAQSSLDDAIGRAPPSIEQLSEGISGRDEGDVARIPPHLRGLAGEGNDVSPNRFAVDENGQLSDLVYGNIQEVQVLSGFEADDANQPLANAAQWSALTTEIIDRAASENRQLVCRFNNFEDAELGITRDESAPPVWNRFFHLIPGEQ